MRVTCTKGNLPQSNEDLLQYQCPTFSSQDRYQNSLCCFRSFSITYHARVSFSIIYIFQGSDQVLYRYGSSDRTLINLDRTINSTEQVIIADIQEVDYKIDVRPGKKIATKDGVFL